MGAERLQPQKLNDFLKAVWNQLVFGGVALWACKGTSQNNVLERSGGEADPLP